MTLPANRIIKDSGNYHPTDKQQPQIGNALGHEPRHYHHPRCGKGEGNDVFQEIQQPISHQPLHEEMPHKHPSYI